MARKKSSIKPDVETLQNDPGYILLLELDFNNLIPFVLKNIRKKSLITFFYAGINLAMLTFIFWYLIQEIIGAEMVWKQILGQSITGILTGTILIIPVHELIHGLVYRLLGAKKIQFGADMQQFIFFVTADRFPVSANQLFLLALSPFLVINSITILLLLFWMPNLLLFAALFLLSHNIMCIGDFAVVNYVMQEKGRVYNFDVISERKSYFYKVLLR